MVLLEILSIFFEATESLGTSPEAPSSWLGVPIGMPFPWVLGKELKVHSPTEMDRALKIEAVTFPPSQGPHLGRPARPRTAADSFGEIPRLLPTASKPLAGLPAGPRAATDQRPQVTHLGTLKPRSRWPPAPWNRPDPSPWASPPPARDRLREPEQRGASGFRGRTPAPHTASERPLKTLGLQVIGEERAT